MAYHSRRHVGVHIIIEFLPNQLEYSRLGITASKRYGNAVARNRFKRIVKEAFRLGRDQIWSGFDFNIKPRSMAKGAKMEVIYTELLSFCSNS